MKNAGLEEVQEVLESRFPGELCSGKNLGFGVSQLDMEQQTGSNRKRSASRLYSVTLLI